MPDQDKNFYRLLAVLEEQEENLWYAIEKNHEAQRAVKEIYLLKNQKNHKKSELMKKTFGEKTPLDRKQAQQQPLAVPLSIHKKCRLQKIAADGIFILVRKSLLGCGEFTGVNFITLAVQITDNHNRRLHIHRQLHRSSNTFKYRGLVLHAALQHFG